MGLSFEITCPKRRSRKRVTTGGRDARYSIEVTLNRELVCSFPVSLGGAWVTRRIADSLGILRLRSGSSMLRTKTIRHNEIPDCCYDYLGCCCCAQRRARCLVDCSTTRPAPPLFDPSPHLARTQNNVAIKSRMDSRRLTQQDFVDVLQGRPASFMPKQTCASRRATVRSQ